MSLFFHDLKVQGLKVHELKDCSKNVIKLPYMLYKIASIKDKYASIKKNRHWVYVIENN